MASYSGRVVVRGALGVLALGGTLAAAACAGTRERVVLEPGVQIADATVDVQSGSVTLERDGVVVTAQGAMLPAPRREALHPTFWVTVENNREERISVTPANAETTTTGCDPVVRSRTWSAITSTRSGPVTEVPPNLSTR